MKFHFFIQTIVCGVFLLFSRAAFAEGTPAQTFFGRKSDPDTAKYNQGLSDNQVWRGSWEELNRTIDEWQQANASHAVATRDAYRKSGPIKVSYAADVERNALNLIPASCDELNYNNEATREQSFSKSRVGDGYHQKGGEGQHINDVYRSRLGPEISCDAKTGAIVLNGNLGTYDFEPNPWLHPLNHQKMDVSPWTDSSKEDSKKMMYVGILWERDSKNPNLYYLVDGNTGQRLTRKEVREAPVTINTQFEQCWVNERYQRQTMSEEERQALGLDSQTSENPTSRTGESVQSSTSATAGPVVQTVSTAGTSGGAMQNLPEQDYAIIDNTVLKSQLSDMLEGTYQYCSEVAAEEGCGAEYQSAVAPVMRQGRSAISSIPDRETITIPAQ